MATEVKRRAGTAAEHDSFTGAAAEITVVTTDWSLRVHDGTTVGGHAIGGVPEAPENGQPHARMDAAWVVTVRASDLATVATSGSFADLTNKPTLGTAAAEDVDAFATGAEGDLAATAVQPGDLGAVATSNSYTDLDNLPTINNVTFGGVLYTDFTAGANATLVDIGGGAVRLDVSATGTDITFDGVAYSDIALGANISIADDGDGTATLNVSSGTATVSDGDYGDVTVSGSGTVWTVDAVSEGVVTTHEGALNALNLVNAPAEAGATANANDAALRDRATHTGAQAISTVTGLQSELDGKQPAGTYVVPGDLGTAAAEDVDAFATGAEGDLAATAVQPGDLGTAAAQDVDAFATGAEGDLAATAVQPGDLGATAFSNSYDDLADKPTINNVTFGGVLYTDFAAGSNATLVDEGGGTVRLDVSSGTATVDQVSNVAEDVILGRVSTGEGNSEELTPAQVRTLLNVEDGATAGGTASNTPIVHGSLDFLTSDADQSLDVSDPATMRLWRTGASWTDERTITFNGVPVDDGLLIISNNSGQDLLLANGTDSPLDLPLDPTRLKAGEVIALQTNNATSGLIKVWRAWETTSTRVVPFGGVAGARLAKVTNDDFFYDWQVIDDLPTASNVNAAADYIEVSVAGSPHKVLVENLPFGSGGTVGFIDGGSANSTFTVEALDGGGA